jgi:hypothetical protein
MGKRKPKINHEQLEAELMTAIKEISSKYKVSAGATMLWCPDGVVKILMHKGGDELNEADARNMMNQFALMALSTAQGENPDGEHFQL